MNRLSRAVVRGLLLALAATAMACAGRMAVRSALPHEALRMPPGGLSPRQVPLFVSFGSDDNPYSGLPASGGDGGLHYLTQLFASRANPPGSGDARSFDGRPLHYSFYVNTKYITPEGQEDPSLVMQSWREAIEQGHEIGVHTHSHPHGRDFGVSEWEREIQLCIDHLGRPTGLGVARNQLTGFRTPFLEYGDATLTAVRRSGFVYDCSLEEGFQDFEDGRNFIWPYSLDHGSPGNAATHERLGLPLVREHPGLWELPVYAFIVPPDELCERYGVARGLRARMKGKNDYFEVEQGKITGMDWNLWFEYGMSKAEFLATLMYTLDLRLEGNRCPLTLGLHSGIYADRSADQPANATGQERRDALREFLDYALARPEVRVVSARELLGWIQSPTPLANAAPSGAPQMSAALGVGFRYSVFNRNVKPDPAYWLRVGRDIGVDVEWNKSTDPDGGEPVSDAEARAWLAAARSHNPQYRLFLKHWLPEKMPPTVRDGLLFVDDSQVLPSLDAMVDEFAVWGKTFAPAPVAFQFGYPSDRPWWSRLGDPPKDIGARILQAVPNTAGLFWVDFSVLEVFPPDGDARVGTDSKVLFRH